MLLKVVYSYIPPEQNTSSHGVRMLERITVSVIMHSSESVKPVRT